jgi:hypothetical protein
MAARLGCAGSGSSFRFGDPREAGGMNKRGNPESLVASHPGNLNAIKGGLKIELASRNRPRREHPLDRTVLRPRAGVVA